MNSNNNDRIPGSHEVRGSTPQLHKQFPIPPVRQVVTRDIIILHTYLHTVIGVNLANNENNPGYITKLKLRPTVINITGVEFKRSFYSGVITNLNY